MISYLFDVDGTLTLPLQRMEPEFLSEFLSWMNGESIYLVAGSDLEKVQRQIPDSVIEKCRGVFCSMGNQFWRGEELVYENDWKPNQALIQELVAFQMYTKFPIRVKLGGRGDIFEFRPGMLNFTTIGRNAGKKERERYYEWDKIRGERKNIVSQLEESYPDIDFRIGGQISIDIQPKGFNKSQASKWIRKVYGDTIYYFGDKCKEGGNDYDMKLDLEKHENDKFFCVNNPNETIKTLREIKNG